MLTIEASNMIMNVPTATKANVIHGLAGSCRALALITATESGRQGCEEREGVLEMLNGHSSIGFGRAIQVAAGTSATPG